jgi:allantoicase
MTATFLDLVDLASERLGAAVVAANDEFFGSKDNLIKAEAPIWREGEYTDRGKWMDGWETRRRREEGHDWCIVRLGVAGLVRGVDVDTSHFKGNHPESCAIEVCDLPGMATGDELARAEWKEVLARTPLAGDSHNQLAVDGAPEATHLRLRIYPDGGVARLRVYGDVVADWSRLGRRSEVDLAAVEHGGVVVACSDMLFGSCRHLIMPGDARHMGDGWETRRRRGPGHDWAIIRLGAPGIVLHVEVDTRHFKGNAPGGCSLETCALRPSQDGAPLAGRSPTGWDAQAIVEWQELLPLTPLQPDARHMFEDQLKAIDEVTHVRFNIFPDGGVGRLRLFGRPCQSTI